jgi:hypothetical protein
METTYAKAIVSLAALMLLLSWGSIGLFELAMVRQFNLEVTASDETTSRADGDNIYFNVRPGESVSGSIPVFNNDTRPSYFTVSLAEVATGRGWVKVAGVGNFTLAPGESRSVDVVVEVPMNASGKCVSQLAISSERA